MLSRYLMYSALIFQQWQYANAIRYKVKLILVPPKPAESAEARVIQ
jgi:hypothetical protein